MTQEPFDNEELHALLERAEISDRHDKEKWRMWLEQRDGCLFLHIEGNCMAIEEGNFLRSINRAFELYPTKRAIIDLSKCQYLSSQSLGVLVTFFNASRERDGQVLLMSPPEKVLKVIKLVGLDMFFLTVESEEMAMQFYQSQEI